MDLQYSVCGVGDSILYCYFSNLCRVGGIWNYLISGLLGLVIVAITVILERNVLGSLQLRTSPIVVSWWGVLQTIVDSVKLLTNGVVGSNVVICSGVFLMVSCSLNVHYGVGWILVILAVIEYAFIASVYYSYSMYSILSGLRAIMSMLAYDILLLIVLLGEVNLWYIVAILVFSAEVGRTPVDLVESESELVSGFNTEYAGSVFVSFFLGEYLSLTLFFFVLWQGINLSIILLSMAILFRGSYPRINYQELIVIMWRFIFCLVAFSFISW